MNVKSLVDKGKRRTIEYGSQTLVWKDNWISGVNFRPARCILPSPELNLRLSDLINNRSKTWNLKRIHNCVATKDVSLILTLWLSKYTSPDGYCWHYTKTWVYTAKSGYEVARQNLDADLRYILQQPSLNLLKERVWRVTTTNKTRHFLWQVLFGAVAVNERLTHRHL